jgi:hypothetical protein
VSFGPPNADDSGEMQGNDGVSRWKKLALVLAGYALAFAASILAVAIYDLRFSPADNQAMGGMIAGGEMMLGGAVFGFVSVVPTGLALWFLRGSRRFWSAFAAAGLAFAIAGLAAVLMPLAARGAMATGPVLALVGLLAIVQMLGSPLWIGGFLLFAAIAPARELRRIMLIAAAIETVIAACGLVHFLMPYPPF